MSDDVMRGPQMNIETAQQMQADSETRAMELISAHVKKFRGNHARAELTALYIVARAYLLHNKLDGNGNIEVFDEAAASMAVSFKR